MKSKKEYQLYCHFCGIGKKTLKAYSFEEAKQMLEDDSDCPIRISGQNQADPYKYSGRIKW